MLSIGAHRLWCPTMAIVKVGWVGVGPPCASGQRERFGVTGLGPWSAVDERTGGSSPMHCFFASVWRFFSVELFRARHRPKAIPFDEMEWEIGTL